MKRKSRDLDTISIQRTQSTHMLASKSPLRAISSLHAIAAATALLACSQTERQPGPYSDFQGDSADLVDLYVDARFTLHCVRDADKEREAQRRLALAVVRGEKAGLAPVFQLAESQYYDISSRMETTCEHGARQSLSHALETIEDIEKAIEQFEQIAKEGR